MKTIRLKYSKAKSQAGKTNCGFASIKFILSAFSILLLTAACSKQKSDNRTLLSPLEVYSVNIPETSDLSFGSSADILYTVSDRTAKVYKITTKGRVLSELSYTGSDLEGVCYDGNQFLYVAEERMRKIIKLDLQGNQVGEKAIPVDINDENQGLEGISFATFNKHFYILNETNPGLLIETDEYLNVLKSYPLSFASDYSGICVDNENQQLWIVSDESESVTKCTLKGELIESYRIPVSNPEGIAFNPVNNDLYVISDTEARLYLFNINNQ
ncbi:MAG: SdiA-regulated domain-containing protein [Bacteroidales bacterium]|nr:SdiA-regulated domain-containing protein [Bacteroidales bacterium]